MLFKKSTLTLLISLCMAASYAQTEVKVEPVKQEVKNQQATPEEEFKLIKEKADAGDVDAQVKYAFSYLYGRGVERDLDKSIKLFSELADKNNSIAQQMMGEFYMNGAGPTIVKDTTKGIAWFEKSAENGNLMLQVGLGRAYREGGVVEKSSEKSLYWMKKAVSTKEIPELMMEISSIYNDAKNSTEAFSWMEKAANKDFPEAQFRLGLMYKKGVNTSVDLNKALSWFEKAGDKKQPYAAFEAAKIYLDSASLRNVQKGDEWLEKSAELGNPDAQELLGMMKYEGKDIKKDVTDAVYWLSEAAQNGKVDAQFKVAFLLDQGVEVKQNHKNAFFWFEKAGRQGHSYAQMMTGHYFLNGIYVPQDDDTAQYWIEEAAKVEGHAQLNELLSLYVKTHQKQKAKDVLNKIEHKFGLTVEQLKLKKHL